MKILAAAQLRELDRYTIENQPIASIDLMERAASRFYEAVSDLIKHHQVIHIFCGMGNNGGDGLVMARMLVQAGYNHTNTYVVRHSPKPSQDFEINEERLKNISGIHYINTENQIPKIEKHGVIIDAIFGSGLSRKVEGIAASVIEAINLSEAKVYSVDVPSGLFCDKINSADDAIVRSSITFTFHAPKFTFMFSGNGQYVPEFRILNIGLMREIEQNLFSSSFYLTLDFVKSIFRKREKFSHKGTYGHALICAGSIGKMGAAVLSVKAALKGGAGLVSANVPLCGFDIMQTTNPEAMICINDSDIFLTSAPELEKFSAVGVGPGIGTEKETFNYLRELFEHYKRPMVIDADALNIISQNPILLPLIPPDSILTPHPGEFKRIAGDWKNDLDKFEKQIEFSRTNKVITILKGAHSSISTPDGNIYFNSTGNPGMAKGGSGDVLTGIITSLCAQKYSPTEAAIIGVYVHGSAGDLAKNVLGETAMEASDIIHYLPKAFLELEPD